MGNCANKPLTAEGEAPVPEEKAVESTEREIVLDQAKVNVPADDLTAPPLSLAQMLEEEEKKPETVEASKAAEEKPAAVEAVKPAEEKPAAVEAVKPAEEKPTTAAAEPAKAEVSEPKKEVKPAEVAPVAAKVEEKKVEAPAAKVEEKKIEAAPVAEKKA